MPAIDFTDVDETALGESLDDLISVLDRLSQLHTSTRMQVLATSYPDLYTRFLQNYELSKSIFES
jgi:hypothetical protein